MRNVPAVYPEVEESGAFSWLKSAENNDDSLYRTVALVVPVIVKTLVFAR